MSWNAHLVDDRGHTEREWGYTHNCNAMIEAVLGAEVEGTTEPWWARLDISRVLGRHAWWELLDGVSGPVGAALLHRILQGLTADPARFRSMNPANGWGDCDSLVEVLTEMRNAVPEWPTTWSVSG